MKGEKLNEIGNPESFLYITSPLVKEARKQEKYEWYKEKFIYSFKETVRFVLDDLGLNIEEVMKFLKDKNINNDSKKEYWKELHDNLKITCGTNDAAVEFIANIGEYDSNRLERCLDGDPADGLNRLVKKYANVILLVLYKEQEDEKKLERDLKIKIEKKILRESLRLFNVENIIPSNLTQMKSRVFVSAIKRVGFVQKKSSGSGNGSHQNYSFSNDKGLLLGTLTFSIHGNGSEIRTGALKAMRLKLEKISRGEVVNEKEKENV